MLKSLLEDFNSNKAFLNFLLHRNSQKASTGAAVKDKFSALQTEPGYLSWSVQKPKKVVKLEGHMTFLKLLSQMSWKGKHFFVGIQRCWDSVCCLPSVFLKTQKS